MIEAVIFDLDGTLINLPIDYEKLVEAFNKVTKKRDFRPLSKKIQDLDEKTRRKIFRIWDNTEVEASTDMTVKDEGMAIYRRFLEKPKALVTLQGNALVRVVLPRLGLKFDHVITRENCFDREGQLTIAKNSLRAAFQNVLFVGNTDNDLQAARKVGCQFLRVVNEDLV